VRRESTAKLTGVPTALQNLVVTSKANVSASALLRRVRDSFSIHLPDLKDVVDELDKDEFKTIPIDEASELVFEGIYLHLRAWKDPSEASEKLRGEKANWGSLVGRIEGLSARMKAFEEMVDENIRLTHSLEADRVKIANLGKILHAYETKLSPYTKFLLSTFADTTRRIIEVKLSEIEKSFQEFEYGVEDEIKRYRSSFESVTSFERDTFALVKKTKDEIRTEFQEQFRNACERLTMGARLHIEDIPDTTEFIEGVTDATAELQILADIDGDVRQCIAEAKQINTRLRAWQEE